MGCDDIFRCVSPDDLKFQSTHPRGVRRVCYVGGLDKSDFNPRTHVGCDGGGKAAVCRRGYFNPRTHVGCDTGAPRRGGCIPYFNPRTHVGCDLNSGVVGKENDISIHAPTWGATVKPSNGWLLGHKDNEFANENIIIINSVNIT